MNKAHAEASEVTLSQQQLLTSITSLTKARVLIVGDVMLDAYLSGEAHRISPEAPVPVVRVDTERLLLGGAGNVARNITALGGQATLIGTRGTDFAGEDLEQHLAAENVTYSLLRLSNRSTTVKTRILARQQQVLRFDREHTHDLEETEVEDFLTLIAEKIQDSNAIVISDYGKGVITKKVMKGLKEIIDSYCYHIPILVDPKPQNIGLYAGVSILTPNAKEASESVNMPVLTKEDVFLAGQRLMSQLQCRHLLITLGSRGMAVFEEADTVMHIPTYAQQVYDVTGAGDTVIATLAMGLACGLPLVDASIIANHAAGVVVGRVGASTITQEELIRAITAAPPPAVERWV